MGCRFVDRGLVALVARDHEDDARACAATRGLQDVDGSHDVRRVGLDRIPVAARPDRPCGSSYSGACRTMARSTAGKSQTLPSISIMSSESRARSPTSPAAMHIATTPSNTRRKASLSRTVRAARGRTPNDRGSCPQYQFAKPPVGQIDLDLSAQPPLRADREHVAHNEHPDHQHRIDRGPARVRVIRRKLLVHPTQIQNTVDLAHQMVDWHHLVELKGIKEMALPSFPLTIMSRSRRCRLSQRNHR